jgi:hypothetical protein
MWMIVALADEVECRTQVDAACGDDALASLRERGAIVSTSCTRPCREGRHVHFQPTDTGRAALRCVEVLRCPEYA